MTRKKKKRRQKEKKFVGHARVVRQPPCCPPSLGARVMTATIRTSACPTRAPGHPQTSAQSPSRDSIKTLPWKSRSGKKGGRKVLLALGPLFLSLLETKAKNTHDPPCFSFSLFLSRHPAQRLVPAISESLVFEK